MFKKILIPTDGSPLATQAAMEGIDLAKKIHAEVVCVYIARENKNSAFEFSHVKPQTWPTAKEYEEAVKQAAGEFMAPMKEAATAGKVKFTEEVFISNSTGPYIIYTAEKNKCDLIYMASRGCAGWENIFLGSVASKVLSASQIPVLVYKVKQNNIPPKAKVHLDVIPMP